MSDYCSDAQQQKNKQTVVNSFGAMETAQHCGFQPFR